MVWRSKDSININRIIDMNAYILHNTTIMNTNDKIMMNNFSSRMREFISDLRDESGVDFTPRQAARKADEILNRADVLGYQRDSATPIVKIIKGFDIDVRRSTRMPNGLSGIIYAGGETKKMYDSDKVIFTDNNDQFEHQRFVMAHELAHYLFDCVCNPEYQNSDRMFYETYPIQNHMSKREIRANRFSAELLMPKSLFVREYNRAINKSNNRFFTVRYLARYFQVKESSIERRIHEVLFDGGY